MFTKTLLYIIDTLLTIFLFVLDCLVCGTSCKLGTDIQCDRHNDSFCVKPCQKAVSPNHLQWSFCNYDIISRTYCVCAYEC